MIARIERILIKLAEQHAPHLVSGGWKTLPDATARIQDLAHRLSAYSVLVLVGDFSNIAQTEQSRQLQDWVRGYGQFYNVMASRLFPSLNKIDARYADDNALPLPVVVFVGEATPVIQCMAGYIAPYLAVRQGQRPVSELEIRGLMTTILDELEAEDLPRAVVHQLEDSGVNIIKALLGVQMRHLSLTPFVRPILSNVPAMPGLNPPQPPLKLPEEGQQIVYQLEHLPPDELPQTPTEEMFRVSLPLPRMGTGKLHPPVPSLKDRPSS